MKIIRCLIALFAIGSHSFRSLKKEYYAPICVDNMLLKAPMMGRDLHMSVTAAIAYALDRYSDPDRRFKTLLFEIPLLFVGYQIVGIH